MERLADLEAFIAIVEQGSQTAAAKRLRRSLQSIHRSLASLESAVGVELLRRSTRSSKPTDAGLRYYRRIRPALVEIMAAERELASTADAPQGLLRITSPVLFGSAFVAPTVCEFLNRYPQVDVNLSTSDRKIDLYDGQFDVAVRIRQLPDSALKVRKIGALRIVTFGAPAYFAKHGRPEHPKELERHECILRSAEPEADTWWFRIRGKREPVRVSGRLRSDDTASMHVAVAAGLGIGMAPLWQIRPLLINRRVEIILDEFESPGLPIAVVSPRTKLPSTNARLFTELLAERMKRERDL